MVKKKRDVVPYEFATSGSAARDEITQLLRRFGCESVGFMDDFDEQTIFLAFKHRGRSVQLKASARGWAALYLKSYPYKSKYARKSKTQYEQAAVAQGLIAVNSILRDWVKGQVTAIECGILSFEAVFIPYTITSDGRTLIERIATMPELLPAPTDRLTP